MDLPEVQVSMGWNEGMVHTQSEQPPLQKPRERWRAHVDDTRMRPVVLVDDAQELLPSVFSEIRLLALTDFDSREAGCP